MTFKPREQRGRKLPIGHPTAQQQQTEPQQGLARLAWKIRTEGLPWIRKRVVHEATRPTTRVGKTVHMLARRTLGTAAALPRAMRRLFATPSPEANTTLFAFYDLRVAPITFDFLWFLTSAELERRRRGLVSIHVVIVPGRHHGGRQEREDYERVISAQARQARIHQILIPCCQLLPSCSGVTLASSREEGAFIRSVVARHIVPSDYEPAMPVALGPQSCLEAAQEGITGIASLRSPVEELRMMQQWAAIHAGSRRVITITLRHYAYMPARNSNIAAWCAFARGLNQARYLPVFVPDFYDLANGTPRELSEFRVMPEAASNIAVRMALYESAFLNFGINNGPMGLAWLNERTRYATLKIETPGVPQASLEFLRSFGFEPGKSLPFATAHQRWVWEDDSENAINRVFKEMSGRIDASEQVARAT